MRNRKEFDHQCTYFQILAANEERYPMLSLIHASMNGASASSKAAAGQRKAQGQKRGVPDVFIPICRETFPGCWIELKIKPNSVSPEQKAFLESMRMEGYKAEVAWSWMEMVTITERYLGIELKMF